MMAKDKGKKDRGTR